MNSSKRAAIWILTDQRKIGTENQCRGLAEALGVPYEVWRLSKPRWPLSWFPRCFWPLKTPLSEKGKPLCPPWPSLLIAAGRTAVAAAAKIRSLSGKKSFVIALQNPHLRLKKFDLVIAPQHDNLRGDNLLETLGALHNVTPEKIGQAAFQWLPRFAGLPQPWVAVLIGGPTKHYVLDERVIDKIISDLQKLHLETGVSLLVTCSRRTPLLLREKLKACLKDMPAVYWEGRGENPYLAYLGAADYIIVTADSVSMLSESLATDKPLYIYSLPGKSKKFNQFHASLFERGVARPFQGILTFWTRPSLQEPQRIANEIKKIKALFQKPG